MKRHHTPRRYAWGAAGAILFMLVDVFLAHLLDLSPSKYVLYTLYIPFSLGAAFLGFLQQRTDLHVPYGLAISLLPFNWACYTLLGFFLGMKLGDVLQRAPRSPPES